MINVDSYALLFITLIEGGILVAQATGDFTVFTTSLDHLEELIATVLAA